MLPQLTVLDACRVTPAERADSVLLLGPIVPSVATTGAENDAVELGGGGGDADEAMETDGGNGDSGSELDATQRAKVLALIQQASSLEEIEKLELMLAQNKVPE